MFGVLSANQIYKRLEKLYNILTLSVAIYKFIIFSNTQIKSTGNFDKNKV